MYSDEVTDAALLFDLLNGTRTWYRVHPTRAQEALVAEAERQYAEHLRETLEEAA